MLNAELEQPELIRRFRAQLWPRHGRSRVPYGQCYDKERALAECLRHGVPTKYGLRVSDLVNPPPPKRFDKHVNDVRERVYKTSWAKPLGRPRQPCLPAGYDPEKVTFGVWMERGEHIEIYGRSLCFNPFLLAVRKSVYCRSNHVYTAPSEFSPCLS